MFVLTPDRETHLDDSYQVFFINPGFYKGELMEILDQLQEKVRNAVQKIEELQNRVNELEEIKRQYESKMESLVQEMGGLDSGSAGAATEAVQEDEKPDSGQTQDSLYRHQF